MGQKYNPLPNCEEIENWERCEKWERKKTDKKRDKTTIQQIMKKENIGKCGR